MRRYAINISDQLPLILSVNRSFERLMITQLDALGILALL